MAEPAPARAPEAPEEEQPAVKPFGAFLHEHRQAGLHNELGEALAEVVAEKLGKEFSRVYRGTPAS